MDGRRNAIGSPSLDRMEFNLDWYVDHVVVPSGPEQAPLGPIRSTEADWLVRRRELLSRAEPSTVRAVDRALEQGFVIRTSELRQLAVPAATVRRLIRRGEWSAVRRGVVSVLGTPGPSALAAVAAVLCRADTVISHVSAAELYGMPLLRPSGPPTVTSDHQQQACSFPGIRMHVAGLAADDVGDWFGAPITSLERTIVDLARSRGLAQGLVAADAALHERLTTPHRLRGAVTRQTGWPGVRRARGAVELADGDAESPAESLGRLALVRDGLPVPELQAWVVTSRGIYRVDMLYRRQRVIVEVDGLLKYGDPRALRDEKIRQEYLERAGYVVVRLMWDDIVRRPHECSARVRAALARR